VTGFDRLTGRGDLLLDPLGAGEGPPGTAVPAARVVEIALQDVHDAVKPGGEGGRVGLDDLVGPLPGAGGEMIDRAREGIADRGVSRRRRHGVRTSLSMGQSCARWAQAVKDRSRTLAQKGPLKGRREPCRLDRDMTAPIKPLPDAVDRWIVWARWLRGMDAAAAWLGLWGALVALVGTVTTGQAAIASFVLVSLGFVARPIRLHWRPVSACVGMIVSRHLRPGDRAWYVRSRRADLVLITACHGVRVVIAMSDVDVDEVLSVRRTRVLLLPADRARAPVE
jgi:hypothetical protein